MCPQGPTNAFAKFHHFMSDILREYLDLIAVGILDDVIILSEDPSQYIKHVRSILQILRDHNVYAKVEKCEFHKDQMTFVGYMVFKTGIGMDPVKVSAILDWPLPKSVKEAQSFQSFANFYRKFIHNYLPDPQVCQVFLVLGCGGGLRTSLASLHIRTPLAALPTGSSSYHRSRGL